MIEKSQIENVQPEQKVNCNTEVDGIPSNPAIAKPHVVCCFSSALGHPSKNKPVYE